MPKIKTKVDYSVPIAPQMREATTDDLFSSGSPLIGKNFWVRHNLYPDRAFPMKVRERVKSQGFYGRDETTQQYRDYLEWIKKGIDNKKIYVI